MKNGIQRIGFKFFNKSIWLACQIKNGFRERITILKTAQLTPGLGLFLLVIAAAIAFAFGHVATAAGLFLGNAALFTTEQTAEIEKLVKSVGDKHKETVKSEIEIAIKAAGFDKDLGTTLMKQLTDKLETLGLKDDVLKTMKEVAEKQGEAMRKLQAGNEPGKVKDVEKIIEEKAVEIAALSKISKNSNSNLIINLSAAEVAQYANKTQVARASVSGSTMAMRLTEVGQLPYLGMKMAQLFRHAQVGPSSNGVIRFYDQAAITRGAGMVAEGATKPESAITWIERMIKVEKIADSIPVTKEAWNDVYFIQSEIERLLNLNLPLKEDQQLWSGTGVTPEIAGVYTTASAVDIAAAIAAGTIFGVPLANIYDLIASMRVLIMNSKQSKYQPNAVVMNPTDILRYKLTKDSFGRYLIPSFVTADGQSIDGCFVIESSQVTANTLLVGDTRYGTIYDLEGVTLEMGYINDQFIKNAMTILAEKRETLLIRNVDADAFLKCTNITDAVVALTAV